MEVPNPQTMRSVLGRFATGVTVVTYEAEGSFRGVTVNSFTSVSLDPPLVLVSLDRRAKASQYLVDSDFTVNVLAAEQRRQALHFAGREQEGLGELFTGRRDGEPPCLRQSIACISCRTWQVHDAGDHVLVIGEVTRLSATDKPDADQPLVFYQGAFWHLGPGHEAKTLAFDEYVDLLHSTAISW